MYYDYFFLGKREGQSKSNATAGQSATAGPATAAEGEYGKPEKAGSAEEEGPVAQIILQTECNITAKAGYVNMYMFGINISYW